MTRVVASTHLLDRPRNTICCYGTVRTSAGVVHVSLEDRRHQASKLLDHQERNDVPYVVAGRSELASEVHLSKTGRCSEGVVGLIVCRKLPWMLGHFSRV
jgi:hypothetical protein